MSLIYYFFLLPWLGQLGFLKGIIPPEINPVHLFMGRYPARGAGLASCWPEDQHGAHLPVEYSVRPAQALIG